MKDQIAVAVVGCGRVMNHYASIFQSGVVSGYRLVGFCDLEIERARRFGDLFGAPAFTDFSTMLQEAKPDLLLVMTPSGLHYEHARIALEHGCHTITEKPITMLPAHGRELAALAWSKGLMYGVVFQNRYNPAIRCLRAAMEEGRFGRLVTATIRMRWCRGQDYYEDGWHGTWAQDGGVINQQAIHLVDALNWLCGPIEAVCASTANRVNRLEAEDTMVAVLRYADGALGTIEATTAARPQDFEASLSVVGERGMAEVGGIAMNRILKWQFVDPRPEDAGTPAAFSQDVPTGYGLSHGPFLQDVIDTLRQGGTEPPVPAKSGLQSVRLVHALYASAERGSWVELEGEPLSQRLGREAARETAAEPKTLCKVRA